MSLYLGNDLISGNKPINLGVRNIGEIVASPLPLTDAGLHLLDGGLILGGGIYQGFVDYIADLYENTSSSWETYIQPTNPSGITSSSGFSNPSNAFDNNSSTYASCGTTTDYIEWDLGETLKVSGFNATIQWVAGYAASCNISIYSVDDNNNETLLANGSGVAQGASGTTSASFTAVEVNKIRFKCIPNDGGQSLSTSTPSRIVQINIIAQEAIKPCFCTESEWQTSVTTYGVCGKFVYDSVNNTVRLPKITGIIEGTTDLTALGDLIQAGLPNITGDGVAYEGSKTPSGAIYNMGSGNCPSTQYASRSQWGFDASKSNSIYGNSTTVQPQTIKVLYYIVIANSTKTEIQSDIDEIATDLNGKADVDLTNVNNSGTSLGAGWAMPSSTYVDLTLGASGSTYIAPANGWFVIGKFANASNQNLHVSCNESKFNFMTATPASNGLLAFTMPIKKGHTCRIGYSVAGNTESFRFIYAEGSESEAQ